VVDVKKGGRKNIRVIEKNSGKPAAPIYLKTAITSSLASAICAALSFSGTPFKRTGTSSFFIIINQVRDDAKSSDFVLVPE